MSEVVEQPGGADGAAAEDAPAPTGADGRPLGSKGEQTRQRLLEAAEEVFATHGYHDASIVKITEACGVAQGTFYLYFEGKLQLFEELVREVSHRIRQTMTRAATQGGTRAESELLGFGAFFRLTAEHPTIYRILRQAEIVAPEVLRDHYTRLASAYADALRAAMAAGEVAPADPEVLAWVLMGAGDFVGMRWVLWGRDRSVPDEVLTQLGQVIARALGSDGG